MTHDTLLIDLTRVEQHLCLLGVATDVVTNDLFSGALRGYAEGHRDALDEVRAYLGVLVAEASARAAAPDREPPPPPVPDVWAPRTWHLSDNASRILHVALWTCRNELEYAGELDAALIVRRLKANLDE